MMVRLQGLGDCNPDTGQCSDGSMLPVVDATGNPDLSMTVTAKAPSGMLSIDPKPLALILGAAFVFLLVMRK